MATFSVPLLCGRQKRKKAEQGTRFKIPESATTKDKKEIKPFTTSCDTQLPGSAPACVPPAGRFANVGSFGYLSGNQISRSYEMATAYTADVSNKGVL